MNWDAVRNWDTIVLALLAIMNLALLVHRRRRRAHDALMKRMMVSLCGAVRRENIREAFSGELRASFGD
jgi:hypothetical protein